MVRIISGTLVDIGRNKISAEEITNILQSRSRQTAGKTLPGKGLFLYKLLKSKEEFDSYSIPEYSHEMFFKL